MATTLPTLPVEYQDPWYWERRAFDVAVKTAIEGMEQTVANVVGTVNLSEFGASPDGIEPINEAWNAMIAEVPTGTRVKINDGNYLVNEALLNNEKEIHVEAFGAKFTRGDIGATAQIASFSGSYGAVNMVNSMSVAQALGGVPLTTTLGLAASPVDLAEGDLVLVIADNYVPASRSETSRQRFQSVVSKVVGNTVTLFGGPYSVDPFSTNIRIARINPLTASWRGGSMTRTADFITPAVGGSMILLRDLSNAVIEGVTIPLSSGAGIQLTGCFNTQVSQHESRLLRDSWSDNGSSGPVFGYHLLDMNSYGTHFFNSSIYGGRHGYSTGQVAAGAGGGTTSNMRAFGVVENAVIEGVYAEGTYVASFDTHEASRNITFDNCVAVGAGYAGLGLRGRDHSVTNFTAIDCYRGIYVFDGGYLGDSYGHRFAHIFIDQPRASGLEADMAAKPPAGFTNFEAEDFKIRGAKGSPIKLTNARIGKLEFDVTWSSSPSADQADIDSTNSEVRGGVIHSDHRQVTSNPPAIFNFPTGDTSIIESDRYRVFGASSKTERISRHSGGTATLIQPDMLFDEQPVGTNAAASSSVASVLDWRTLSGDDSGRLGVSGGTTDLSLLGKSMRAALTLQVTITAAKTLPNLPSGRFSGQILNILNRPATGTSGQSTANLTVPHGGTIGAPNGANTWMIGAANKTLTPGQSCKLMWDPTFSRWMEF